MSNYIYDTSALLNGAYLERDGKDFHFITPIVLKEIETIKNSSSKDELIKAAAREFVRYYRKHNNDFIFLSCADKVLNKIKKQHKQLLTENNDALIISYAFYLKEKMNDLVILVTSDLLMYEIASALNITTQYYEVKKKTNEEEYTGWKIIHPTNEQFVSLYTNPKENVFNCLTNQYAELFEGDVLKDLVVWTGEKYESVKWQNIRNPYTQEIIKPRNTKQKMVMNMLQNERIKVALLTARYGAGKTLLALNYALSQVEKGAYDKIIYLRNNIIVKNTNDVGFMPGTLPEKMLIWGLPMAAHLGGVEVLEQLIGEGSIEIFPISHIRGLSIKNSIVLCDECENLDDKLVALIISRIEESSKLIFCGDYAQTDTKHFEENNGIRAMLERLKGENKFGVVKLMKTERGETASLADRVVLK